MDDMDCGEETCNRSANFRPKIVQKNEWFPRKFFSPILIDYT